MKVKVTTEYICEVCGRAWGSEKLALQCERYPAPALQPGDIILWTGRRDDAYGAAQSLVVDWVKEVDTQHSVQPGHPYQYVVEKQYAFEDYRIKNQRHGYVNFAGAITGKMLHSERLSSAMRDGGVGHIDPVYALLERAGLAVQPAASRAYAHAIEWEYTHVSFLRQDRMPLYGITPDGLRALRLITRDITDEQALGFVMGHGTFRNEGPFSDHVFSRWGAMVDYDLDAALLFLQNNSPTDIIAAVRAYRAQVLAGTALLSSPPMALFPIDRRMEAGVWDRDALKWFRAQGVTGSGKTRLERAYKALDAAFEQKGAANLKLHAIFEGKQVIAVLAGKGGVGKSTVAANLARALRDAGRKVLVFDADFYGPSQPLLFPVDEPRLKTRNKKILPHQVDGVEVFSFGHLMQDDEALDWRGVYLQAAMHTLAMNLDTEADTVVIDMPPGTGDILIGLLQMCPQVGFLFVATAGEVALADVRRAINTLDGPARTRIMGLVENMAYIDAGGQRVQLWGGADDVRAVARDFNLRFAGKLPMSPDAQVRLDAVKATALPLALDFINGVRYQDVSATLDELLERAAAEKIARLREIAILSTDVPNLVQHLECAIADAGGDPHVPAYRDKLRAALDKLLKERFVIASISEKFIASAPTGDEWWADAFHRIHTAPAESEQA